jgi:anti-sigma regulatory factor (Ser/Thr protein kinase)
VTEKPTASVDTVMKSMVYGESDDLARIRSFVRASAAGLGLPAPRTELLVLAITELATNTLQHTAGGGELKIWKEGRQVVCEIADEGRHTTFRSMPSADSRRGRGLAIVQHVVDHLSLHAQPTGTVVQIRMDC